MKIFESFLAPLLDEYLIYRKNLGYTTETTLNNLKVFDRYVKEKRSQKVYLSPHFFLS